MKLDQHVQQLCKTHGITRIVKPGRGRARVESRVIRHPPIREQMNYFVALHEVGHVVNGLGGTRLEREALAWKYALDEAVIEPHFSIRQRICACLVRYLYRAQTAGWKLPEKGDLYWDLLVWWSPSSHTDLVETSTTRP